MPISETGYAHWRGEFIDRRLPWWPITRLAVRLAFKKKGFKFVFIGSLLPAFFFLAGIYISERLEDFTFMMKGTRQFLEVNPAYFRTYFTGDFLLFMMVVIMVIGGAGLIADDLKYNSLQIYFARPLRKQDYFLGKVFSIFFFLMFLTFIPGLVFIIMKLVFAGNFKFLAAYPWLPLSVILYSLVLTIFFSFYTLLVSSLNRNRRYVSILLFLIYIFSDVFFGIFYGIFHNPYFALISIKSNLQVVGAALFRVKAPFDVPWLYSFLVLLAICVLSGFVLKKRIRGVEVIK